MGFGFRLLSINTDGPKQFRVVFIKLDLYLVNYRHTAAAPIDIVATKRIFARAINNNESSIGKQQRECRAVHRIRNVEAELPCRLSLSWLSNLRNSDMPYS